MDELILPQDWKPLRKHRDQSAIWRTQAKLLSIVAGRGSGKTEISRRYMICHLPLIKPWSDPRYMIGFPTYGQAKRVVWPQLEALMPKHWLAKNGANKTDLTFTTRWGSTLIVVGMDKPHRVEGVQMDGIILDESSDQRPGIMKTIAPMMTHRDCFLWRIGVPKRAGCGAKEFKDEYDKGLQGIDGRQSYSWPSWTVLSEEELFNARALLGDEDAEEQLGGVWLDATGAVFYAFKEGINVREDVVYNPNERIGVGSDFNVTPMAWVLFHVRGGKMYVFDEIYLSNTNTGKTLDYLWNNYGGHKNGWSFFGDASSQARHTAATSTDFIQIMNDTRFDMCTPKKVFYPKANPPVRDRFAATNALLLNANKVPRLFISPKCKNLRSDLQVRSYKEGTVLLPSKEGELGIGHITDALGYPIYNLFPIRVNQKDTGKVFSGQQTHDLI